MVKLDWVIREARSADSDGLKICMEAAYAPYQERMEGKRLPPMDIDYSSEIDDYPVWVVEYDERIVGGVILLFQEDLVVLANIAVHPDFQSCGIGSGLMNFAESMAREKSCKKLRLATHVLLDENISLYRHLGWREVDRDESRVCMEKEI